MELLIAPSQTGRRNDATYMGMFDNLNFFHMLLCTNFNLKCSVQVIMIIILLQNENKFQCEL
jgi:hypothetical protein